MQELRLVGVQENGAFVVLAASDGTRYRLRLDEDLRVAARRGRPPADAAAQPALTAKDVQALVRAGQTSEEVAERSGWPVSKVNVFAAPVLAERAHVAGLAGEVRLRVPGEPGNGERLLARVGRRLAGRGVAADDVEWDASRDESGIWRVNVAFAAGGRERRAVWRFDHSAGLLESEDDEARWLSENDDPASVRPQPHRFGGEAVFDVEASGGLAPGGEGDDGVAIVTTVHAPAGQGDQTDALMTAIRAHSHAGERRGRRRRRDEPAKGTAAGTTGAAKRTGPGASTAQTAGEPTPGTGATAKRNTPGTSTHAPTADDPTPAPVAGAASAGAEVVDAGLGSPLPEDTADPGPTGIVDATDPASSRPEGRSATDSPGASQRAGSTAPEERSQGEESADRKSVEAQATPTDAADAKAGDNPRLQGADELPFAEFGHHDEEESATPAAPAPATATSSAADSSSGAGSSSGALDTFPDSEAIPPAARGPHPQDREPLPPIADEDDTPDSTAPASAALQPGEDTDAASSAGSGDEADAHAPDQGPTAHPQPESQEPELPLPADESDPESPRAAPSAAPRRKGRVGVPSWNDVMFGPARTDD